MPGYDWAFSPFQGPRRQREYCHIVFVPHFSAISPFEDPRGRRELRHIVFAISLVKVRKEVGDLHRRKGNRGHWAAEWVVKVWRLKSDLPRLARRPSLFSQETVPVWPGDLPRRLSEGEFDASEEAAAGHWVALDDLVAGVEDVGEAQTKSKMVFQRKMAVPW